MKMNLSCKNLYSRVGPTCDYMFSKTKHVSSINFRRNINYDRPVWRLPCGLLSRRNTLTSLSSSSCFQPQARFKSTNNKDNKGLSSLFHPVSVNPCNDLDGISIGEELAGTINKGSRLVLIITIFEELKSDETIYAELTRDLANDLLKLINDFYRRSEIKLLAAENGLDHNLFYKAYVGFRRFCLESEQLPVDLHIALSDILNNAGHVDDIFPYFLRHAKTMFPHLDCMDDLRKISDLRLPANWYPEARSIQRKIIFHAGPTNSGKTYHALERFYSAKSGVYCGPLRLLANEVFRKSNMNGTFCDLITGEERKLVSPDGNPANHIACTVEMTNVAQPYEVAVIDEIQMIRDTQRGWAWTRAFLGVYAEEVHLCGEESAIDLIKDLALQVGDIFEVRRYKRLTQLKVLDKAVNTFDNIRAGDCIVCFSKNDIYTVSRQLEKRGIQVAVIYGTLPPGTKLIQAEKFNDPNHPCKVMVATDAIGMGINLSISRVVFYTLMKPYINEKGEKEMDIISPSTALQIAGRAGRFASQFVEGTVTTFKGEDLAILKKLLKTSIEPIQQAGLHPTAEQIELFAYHLPKATLSNLIDIFVTLSQLDNDRFFMCYVDDFKFLADMIEHIPLQLRVRYVLCCAPIPKKQPFVCTMFLKFARQFSRGFPLTLEWLCRNLGWPFKSPNTIVDLVHLECVFDVLDLYLWLSYRFTDMFPDVDHIRDMQKELDEIIQIGVYNIVKLLKNSETMTSSGVADNEDEFEIQNKSQISKFTVPALGADDVVDDEITKKTPQQKQQQKTTLSARFQSAKASKDESDMEKKTRLGKIDLKPGQRVSEQLIKHGLLTKNLLKKLQEELANDARKDFEDDEKN